MTPNDDPTRSRNAPPPDAATRTADGAPPPEETASHGPNVPDLLRAIGLSDKTTDATHSPPVSVPGYAIEGELGRGGMGVVYRARQVALGRVVALKTLLRGFRDAKLRFLAEAEAVAAVRHPNVVQVHDYGEADGQPFLALEFLPGGTLTQRLRSGRLDPLAAAPLVEKIARGVGAAHAAGIVHRDLKPGNVLFDADGEPKVTDFGLAKRDSGAELTHTGAIMGTPHYMSPEQAGGRTKFVGPPADVWALGVILYECLTGQRPFDADSVDAVLSRVLLDAPPGPRKLVPGLPRDLELICLKCLEKGPSDRYPTATELAADLRRFAAGDPVGVRAAGPAERVLKWARRKPTAAAAWGLSALAVLLAVVVFVVVGFWRDAERAKGAAESARDRLDVALGTEKNLRGDLEGAKTTLERVRYGQTMLLAHQAWNNNDVTTARRLLAGTKEEYRGIEFRYVHRLCHSEVVTAPWEITEGDRGYSMAFSPDGQHMATLFDDATRVWDARIGAEVTRLRNRTHSLGTVSWSPDGTRLVTVVTDKTARMWDAKSGAELATLKGHTDDVSSAEFSPDSSRVVTASADKTVRVWDAKTGAEILQLKGHKQSVWFASYSLDGNAIVAAAGALAELKSGETRVWDAKTGTVIATLRGHLGFTWSANVIRPDGTRVVTADGTSARVWDVKTGAEVCALSHPKAVACAVFSPDGTRILTSCMDSVARVWDASTGSETLVLRGHSGRVNAVAFSPDGNHIATTSADKTVRLWNAKSGGEVTTFKGHAGNVFSLAFSKNGNFLATGAQDRKVRVWDTRFRPEQLRKVLLPKQVKSAVLSPDGAWVLTITYDPQHHDQNAKTQSEVAKSDGRVVRVWDVSTGTEVTKLVGHDREIQTTDFDPSGRYVVTASEDKTARIWDVKTGREVVRLTGHTGPVKRATYSPDGTRVATCSADKTGRVWDTRTGTATATLIGHTDAVRSVEFSPDGSLMVTTSADETALVWDAKTGKKVCALTGYNKQVGAAWFSPDGLLVAALGGSPRTVRLWEARTGVEIRSAIPTHEAELSVVGFCPTTFHLVVAFAGGRVGIWNPHTGEHLGLFQGHLDDVNSVSFNSDGTRLLTVSSDETIRIWDTASRAEVLCLQVNNSRVYQPTFDRAGSRVIARDDEGVLIWDSSPIKTDFIPKPPATAPRAK